MEMSEAQLLERMKGLALRYQNPSIQVKEFLKMSQHTDEGLRHCLSRLKGIADGCKFQVFCTCRKTNSSTEKIMIFKLIAG